MRLKGISTRTTAAWMLPASIAFAVMASRPPERPPSAPFSYLTLRLHNGAAIQTGALSHLQLHSDTILRIGNGEKAIEFPISQIEGWSYELTDTLTVGKPAVETSGAVAFRVENGGITVSGLRPNDGLYLTSPQGTCSVLNHNNDAYFLSTSSMPKGIYILTAAGRSFKFIIH